MWKGLFPVIIISTILLFSACQKAEELSGSRVSREQITEEEQQSFEGCLEPGMMSQESALASLKILTRGGHETIRYYREFEQSEESMLKGGGEMWYQNDICATVKLLSKRNNPEAYDLILQVIEQKTKYPQAMVCAIRAIMIYGEFKDGTWHGDKRSIPVLKQIVNNENPDIRLNTAGALLSLGEGGTALPVIDEFAKAGTERSITAMHKLFTPEEKEIGGVKRIIRSSTRLFDERGKDILVRALNYSSDEVKAFAASRLAQLGIEQKLAEDTAIEILKRRMDNRSKRYENMDERQRENNTVEYAVDALEETGKTDGTDMLKKLSENHTDPAIRTRAQRALEIIKSKQSPP